MKISILLPYKENFSPTYAGAVSLFIKDTIKLSKFRNKIIVYGNTELKNKCIGHNKNKIYFIDRTHLSKESARLISVDLIKLIDNIYKTKN